MPSSTHPRTHLLTALLVLGVIILAIFVVGHHTSSVPPTTTTTTVLTPSTTTTTTISTTTTTVKQATPSATLPSQASYPAYAHLPFDGDGVTIAVTGTTGNRLNVEVFSQTLTVAQEKAVYAAFLAQYHDPGTKYLPVFSSSLSATNG